MGLLTEAEYKATMGTPMTRLQPEDVANPIPLGEYFGSIGEHDLEGHDFHDRTIEHVYREPTGRLVHVLIASGTPNLYLVIIVDEKNETVHGHHLLDLNRAYGHDPGCAVICTPPDAR